VGVIPDPDNLVDGKLIEFLKNGWIETPAHRFTSVPSFEFDVHAGSIHKLNSSDISNELKMVENQKR